MTPFDAHHDPPQGQSTSPLRFFFMGCKSASDNMYGVSMRGGSAS